MLLVGRQEEPRPTNSTKALKATIAHWDYGEDARVLLNSVTCTVSVSFNRTTQGSEITVSATVINLLLSGQNCKNMALQLHSYKEQTHLLGKLKFKINTVDDKQHTALSLPVI